MRLVLDTGVIVSGLRSSEGASRLLLDAVLAGAVEAVVTVPLVVEYEAVATRPEHLARSGLTAGEVREFIDAFVAAALRVNVRTRARPTSVDPADDMVLEAGMNGDADAIVAFNVRHLREGATRLNLRVLRPADAIRELREELEAP